MEPTIKLHFPENETIDIQPNLHKYFNTLFNAYKDHGLNEFVVAFVQEKALWMFIIETLQEHDEFYEYEEPAVALKEPIDNDKAIKTLSYFSLDDLYRMMRACDFYDIRLFLMLVAKEVMRRLLCMTTQELLLTHRDISHQRQLPTSMTEVIVADCARQALILAIIRERAGDDVVGMIENRFLPRPAHLVATGAEYSLVITTRGVFGMGDNHLGQLAQSPLSDTATKFSRVPLADVISICAGESTSLFLTSCGHLYSAGDNSSGQLGRNQTESFLAARIPLEFVLTMACGTDFAVALTTDGVYAWGANDRGQLGNGTNITRTNTGPERVDIDAVIVDIACGGGDIWTMLSDIGEVYICGDGENFKPRKIAFPDKVKKMICTAFAIIVLLHDDSLYGWGYITAGGMINTRVFTELVKIEPFASNSFIVHFFAGASVAFFIDAQEACYVTGDNDIVASAIGIDPNANMPVNIAYHTGIIDADNNRLDSLLLERDGLYQTQNANVGLPVLVHVPLLIGHEQYANNPIVATYKNRQHIIKTGLSCHRCGNTSVHSLHLSRVSGKLFCNENCLYHK